MRIVDNSDYQAPNDYQGLSPTVEERETNSTRDQILTEDTSPKQKFKSPSKSVRDHTFKM